MSELVEQQFEEHVLNLAHWLFHEQSQGGHLSARSPSTRDAGEGEKFSTVEEVLAASEQASKGSDIRSVLCACLKSTSGDLTAIAKAVVTALLPLSISKQVALPVDPMIYAGLSLLVFNTSVKVFCPDPDRTP